MKNSVDKNLNQDKQTEKVRISLPCHKNLIPKYKFSDSASNEKETQKMNNYRHNVMTITEYKNLSNREND